MCGQVDIGCYIREGFQSVATSALDQLKEGTNEAALRGLHSLATFWLEPGTPQLAEQQGQTWKNSDTVGFMQDRLLTVVAAVFIVAVLIAGIRTAWEQRARPLQELLKTMLIFVTVAAAGTAVMQLLTSWSDQFAVYIVHQAAADPSLANAFGGEVDDNGVVQRLVSDNVPTLLAISIYGPVIVASLIQVVLMLVRSAMLVLLAGTFPLAAAATNTEIGRNWFRKYCGWALAFIAYKPAAALIYAAALKLSQANLLGGEDDVVRAMTGMMMLLLAIFALPALLRFMVPVTAAVAGGSAGMGSSVADPGGAATGAINIGRSGFGSGSGGGGGGGSSSGGGGASGAKGVGAAASVGLGAAGAVVNGARKVAGSVAGAAAHSAGESGGGSVTPTSSFGPTSRGGSPGRSARAGGSSGSADQRRVPEPAGPSGSR
jgi:type IV secretion system protein TrbL